MCVRGLDCSFFPCPSGAQFPRLPPGCSFSMCVRGLAPASNAVLLDCNHGELICLVQGCRRPRDGESSLATLATETHCCTATGLLIDLDLVVFGERPTAVWQRNRACKGAGDRLTLPSCSAGDRLTLPSCSPRASFVRLCQGKVRALSKTETGIYTCTTPNLAKLYITYN